MGFSKTMDKIILIVFNLIILLIGILTITLGVAIKFARDKISILFSDNTGLLDQVEPIQVTTNQITMLVTALIVTGTIVLFIGFAGCCGACCENKVLLLMYIVAVSLVVFVELILTFMYIGFKGSIQQHASDFLHEALMKNYTGMRFNATGGVERGGDTLSMAWDFIMVQLECCGHDSAANFQEAQRWNPATTINTDTFQAKIPLACCKVEDGSSFLGNMQFTNALECMKNADPDHSSTATCVDKLKEMYSHYELYAIIIIVVELVVSIIGIAFAIFLRKCIVEE